MLASWQQFFSTLPERARILDICTGNGAIAILANQVSRRNQKDFEIHGIDQAAIDPRANVKSDPDLLQGIHFRPGTPCERTGFPDEYFDAVTGQYALEYTHMEEALPEIKRVCRAGARIMFVLHHARSIVMRITRQEIQDATLLFDDADLFGKAKSLITKVGMTTTPSQRRSLARDREAEALRHAFNAAAGAVSEAVEQSPQPEFLRTALSYVTRAYKALDSGGLQRSLLELQESEAELRAHVGRLQDLLRAAVSEERLAWVVLQLETLGFAVEPTREIYHDEKSLMGWQLEARLEGENPEGL